MKALDQTTVTTTPSPSRDLAMLKFLENGNRCHYPCELSTSLDFETSTEAPREVFSQILVACIIGRRLSRQWQRSSGKSLRRAVDSTGWVHFFEDRSISADSDCLSLRLAALAALQVLTPSALHQGVTALIANQAADQVIQVYRDPSGRRDNIIDEAVAINALHAINRAGRADEAKPTERFVNAHLTTGGFAEGTRYYPSPDTFLYFLSRLLRDFPDRYAPMRTHAEDALRGRFRAEGNVAQRCIAAERLGTLQHECALARDRIKESQGCDGRWQAYALYRYGRRSVYFGSATITTAFAARALWCR